MTLGGEWCRIVGAAIIVVGPAVAACGGSAARTDDVASVEAGDPYGAPSILVVPSLDVPREELTERMRFGWTLTEESLDLPRPPAPPGGRSEDFQQWADGELQAWLERKSHTVDAARRELDAAAEENHRQRILAGALVGLMYEDVARELRDLPTPAEIQRDPEIEPIFRDVIEAQAAPYLEFARQAFEACAANARGGAVVLEDWGAFCATRADNLPPPRQ